MARGYAGPDLFTMNCEECGKLLVTTSSGYLSCPRGHGRLKIAGQVEPAKPEPTYRGRLSGDDDCRYCGHELEAGQVDAGALYCVRCVQVLERHAAIAGLGV